MERYINAEHFDERVRLAVGLEGANMTYDFKLGIQATLLLLKTEPTADVVEVMHGEWIWNEHNQRVCSNCQCPVGFIQQNDGWHEANYCPNCGADMRLKGGTDDN